MRRRRDAGNTAVEAGTREDTLRTARIEWKVALMALVALLVISQLTAAAQQATVATKSATTTHNVAGGKLPKIWHSEATKHDFRVEVTSDSFHAEWINVPPAAAKRGAFIRTNCRKAGSKWVGSSSINMLFAVPGAPAGKDSKLCSLSVRFEVDSVSVEKITGHSETIHAFDVNACRAQQTTWGEFTWVPKK
jgi:hypothetical protein